MLRRTVSVRAAAVAAVCFVSANASAEQYWNVGAGNLADTANYITNGDANPTWYNIGVGGVASFPGTGPSTFDPGRLRIGNGNAALNPGDGTLNMTDGTITPGGLNQTNPDGINAGLTIGLNAVGVMNQSGGSVTSTRFVIVGSDGTNNDGSATPGSGTLNLSGTANIRSTNNDMIVGLGNPGTLTVADSAIVNVLPTSFTSTQNPNLTIGAFSTSTYNQTGGTVNVANSMQIGAGSTATLSGGTLTTRFKNAANGFPTVVAPNGNLSIGTSGTNNAFIQTGGTLNVGNQMTVGQGTAIGTTFSISGIDSVLNTKTGGGTGTGNITVGTGTSVGSIMTIAGGTIADHGRFLVGGGSSTGNIVNHSAGSLTIDQNFVVSDVSADSTYNFSGGTITANSEISRVGRHGTGTMIQTGGIANFNSVLAIGDDANDAGLAATGVYQISAGEVHTALATGQTGGALRIGTLGTGTFCVVGDDGIIDVNGNMTIDNTAKGVGTLAYRFEAGDSLSVIDVSGTATFNSGSALVADTSIVTPTQRAFDVLTATSVVDNGVVDSAGWTHRVINGGANGKLLQIAQLGTFYWDTDGANPGAGGATPTGTWDAGTTNLSADSTGSSATTPLSTAFGDDVIFAAGTDGTGSYTVTVSDTQTARSVSIARGDVTLTGGTLAVGTFDVAAGASGTVASSVTGSGSGSVTKTGPGTLTLTAANTYTGGTNAQAGTLEVTKMHAGNAVNVAAGATLRVLHSAPAGSDPQSGDNAFVSQPSTLTVDAAGTVDITNNDIVLDYSGASPLATYEALVRSAYNVTGDWQGPGITSSIAANDGNYVVAIADNAALAAPFGTAQGGPLFAGVDVDIDTVLIKFTHRADINLDGLVTPDDSAIFGGNYDESITTGHTWAAGDMNYDGACTPDDAAIFGGAYDESLTSLPEPGSLSLLAVCTLGLARRRTRRHLA